MSRSAAQLDNQFEEYCSIAPTKIKLPHKMPQSSDNDTRKTNPHLHAFIHDVVDKYLRDVPNEEGGCRHAPAAQDLHGQPQPGVGQRHEAVGGAHGHSPREGELLRSVSEQ